MAVSYKELKAEILQRIVQGDWPPGSLLPGEVELAERHGCARATLNRAMRDLAEDGIVERRRKAGTRVRMAPVRQARFDIPLIRKEIEGQGSTYRYALLTREEQVAPDWLCGRLGLSGNTPVLHVKCMHYADNTPYQHEDRWIDISVLPAARTADFTATGPNEWLVAAVPFSTVEMSFRAVQADEAIAGHMDCTVGAPLFQTERSTWWEERAITFVRLTFREGYRMTTRY